MPEKSPLLLCQYKFKDEFLKLSFFKPNGKGKPTVLELGSLHRSKLEINIAKKTWYISTPRKHKRTKYISEFMALDPGQKRKPVWNST